MLITSWHMAMFLTFCGLCLIGQTRPGTDTGLLELWSVGHFTCAGRVHPLRACVQFRLNLDQ